MHGENVVPPVSTGAWGFVRFFFNDSRTEADYTVDVKGTSAATGADMFRGAPGANGTLVRHLAEGNFLTHGGHLQLTPAELQDLVSGAYYVVLYTTRHPEGELRGQVYVPCGFIGNPPPGCTDPQFAGIPAPNALHSVGTGDAQPIIAGTPPGPAPTPPPPPENPGAPPGPVAGPAQAPRAGVLPPNTGDGGVLAGDKGVERALLVGIAAVIIGAGLIVLGGSPRSE